MLDNDTIHNLTREAKPLDFKMLRSYIRWAPSTEYVRKTMLPALRRRHPTIWIRMDSDAAAIAEARAQRP